MTIYKPSKICLQYKNFECCGKILKFPDEFKHFNAVRTAFNQRAYFAQVEMTECYESQIHSVEQILSLGIPIMERINRESAEFAVSVLMYYGIENVTPEKIVSLSTFYTEKTFDGKRYSYHKDWNNIFRHLVDDNLKPVRNEVKNVANYQKELSVQRQIQRAGRSRWQGGGFGLKGALKGAMMAGLLNAGTSIFRGIGDSFVDASDAARTQKLKNAVVDGKMPLANFNYIVKNYVMNLYLVVKSYLDNTIGCWQPDVPGPIKYTVSSRDIENAVGKFSNYELFYKNGAKTAEEVKKAIFDYMLVNIWDVNALRALYLLCEDAKDKESIILLTPQLGLQYEFASIALNIDQDLLEKSRNSDSEANFLKIQKGVAMRTEALSRLISATDAQLEDIFLHGKPVLDEKSEKDKDESKDSGDTSTSSSKQDSAGCYIATSVYGSYDCPAVWTLRRYRDCTLAETWYGRIFIRCYYAISPTIVKWFGTSKWFKNFWRCKLDRFVGVLQEKGIASTPYDDVI